MKIIIVDNNYGGQKNLSVIPEIYLKPDSALLKSNKPFFIPEFASQFVANIYPTIRINRLGKHIAPRFASRYYNEIGLGISLVAQDLWNQQMDEKCFGELSRTFDGSAVISEFSPMTNFADTMSLNFDLQKDAEIVQQGNIDLLNYNFNELIAFISRYMTLKIGDIIFAGSPMNNTKIEIGNTLSANLDNKNLIHFNIK